MPGTGLYGLNVIKYVVNNEVYGVPPPNTVTAFA